MARKRRTLRYQEVPCRGCGTPFKAIRIDAMWCSECRVANAKRYVHNYDLSHKTRCVDCGKEIVRSAKRCRICDNKWRAVRYRGEANPNWQGGRIVDNLGYAHMRVKPSGPHPYRLEHHIVWERTHNKPLPKGWVVHHFNGIKDDNRPENLLGISRRDHHTQHRAYERRIRQLEDELRILQQLRLAG